MSCPHGIEFLILCNGGAYSSSSITYYSTSFSLVTLKLHQKYKTECIQNNYLCIQNNGLMLNRQSFPDNQPKISPGFGGSQLEGSLQAHIQLTIYASWINGGAYNYGKSYSMFHFLYRSTEKAENLLRIIICSMLWG